MNLKVKKRCTYAVIVLYNLSIGIGYAIIFPTIWNYVHERYGGSESMLGLVISSYSVSSFFANLVVGWLGDRTQNTKIILLLTIIAEVAGSFMYFLGVAAWFLVLSRLIAGLGGGGGAVVIADITRTTTEEERTPVLAMVVSSRQFGLLVGPALTLFLCRFDFHIGSLPVDKFTSPGLFMTLLWLFISLLVIFLYNNLTELKDEEDVEQLFPGYRQGYSIPNENMHGDFESSSSSSSSSPLVTSYPNYSSAVNGFPTLQYSTLSVSVPNLQADDLSSYGAQADDIKVILCKKLYGTSEDPAEYSSWKSPYKNRSTSECSSSGVTDNMIETAERLIQSVSKSNRQCEGDGERESQGQCTTRWFLSRHSEGNVSGEMSTPTSEARFSLGEIVDRGFLRDEVVVLMGLSFISCFAQTVLETVVTPLAQKLYNFTEMQNSLLYLFSGIEVIIIYIVLRYVSHKVSDRWLLLFGVVVLCIATAVPLTFVPNAELGGTTFPGFVITVILDLIGIAVIVVCSASLLSKVIDQEKQAFAQGIRRSMVSLGCILGPLWGGGYLRQLYALFAIPLALSIFIAVLLVCSFKRLKPEEQN